MANPIFKIKPYCRCEYIKNFGFRGLRFEVRTHLYDLVIASIIGGTLSILLVITVSSNDWKSRPITSRCARWVSRRCRSRTSSWIQGSTLKPSTSKGVILASQRGQIWGFAPAQCCPTVWTISASGESNRRQSQSKHTSGLPCALYWSISASINSSNCRWKVESRVEELAKILISQIF